MAQITLDLSKFKADGIYTIEYDASQSIVLNTQTTRLVIGFSKNGPYNAPVYCQDVKTARSIFGDIDTDLENKGSFFHRSLFTCLETGPCFALALMNFVDDTTSPNVDYDTYQSFSLSTTEANGATSQALYSSFFNKQRFYFPDQSYFLANVANNTINAGKILNFVNLGRTPFSIFITKSGDSSGFNITARDWFGVGNVPSFVKDFDYVSDYFINVDIVAGDWTNYNSLSVDPTFSKYFNTKGVIASSYSSFLASNYVTRIGSFKGCIIPDLTDNNGVNYSIDTIINGSLAKTGLFCALDRVALADYDSSDTTSKGRVDMIGHSLIDHDNGQINFLSYNFPSDQNQLFGPTANSFVKIDLGVGATANLPAVSGYSADSNGFYYNLPTGMGGNKVAWFESYYGSGNQGKFNNLLVLRKSLLSDSQFALLASVQPGVSLIQEGVTGATHSATVTSVYQVVSTTDGDTLLKIAIANPAKSLEGTTNGKYSPVANVDTTGNSFGDGAPAILVYGTGPLVNVNIGDWIYTQQSSLVYYFRVNDIFSDGNGNTIIGIDTFNPEFNGTSNIANLALNYSNTFVYWESIGELSGSLFDVVPSTYLNTINSLSFSVKPIEQTYVSLTGAGQSYYIGYPSSDLYNAFSTGLLSNGDKAEFMSGVYPQSLYVSSNFTYDVDGEPIVKLYAYRDSAFTIPYTGSWDFSDNNAEGTPDSSKLVITSLIGDYSASIGATGFNTSYTSCYIANADSSKVQVGQFLVADPLNTEDNAQFILTRVISKKYISSGTYQGYYQIGVNQRLANISGFNQILRYKSIQSVALNYQPTFLPGFNLTPSHVPNGSDSRLESILSMIDPNVTNIPNALASKHIISFRYIVDTFDGGLAPQSAPKNLITQLALNRQKSLAIMNAPSIAKFIKSTNPYFCDAPTQSNPVPLFDTAYIPTGGNLSLGPSFVYSLPDQLNGSEYSGFFSPFLTITENGKNKSIPPAADVSNNFIQKFINGQPYAIVAGPRRGVLSNPKLVGLEYDFTDTDRANVQPFGWNPIVFRRGTGFMIHGNQSAYQAIPSALNSLHVRDILITIEDSIENILSNFLYEFNDVSTRLQIKTIVDSYLGNIVTVGGLTGFTTVMDTSNNTPDIIDQNFAILDVLVTPPKGMQKFINRVTIQSNGGVSSGGFTTA